MNRSGVIRVCGVVITAVVITACSGSGSGTSTTSSSVPESTQQSTSTAVASSVKASGPDLGAVVCTTPPTRMAASAEVFTSESWTCSRSGEQVRIDLYESDDQQSTARKILLDFYRSLGDQVALSDLPVVCGNRYVIGFDFNRTRDAAIVELKGAGFEASTC